MDFLVIVLFALVVLFLFLMTIKAAVNTVIFTVNKLHKKNIPYCKAIDLVPCS
jgi:hypothetical protein